MFAKRSKNAVRKKYLRGIGDNRAVSSPQERTANSAAEYSRRFVRGTSSDDWHHKLSPIVFHVAYHLRHGPYFQRLVMARLEQCQQFVCARRFFAEPFPP